MNSFLFDFLDQWFPTRILSRWFGDFASATWPDPLRLWILRFFASWYRLNMKEADRPLADYPTLDALFTRRLKLECRPIKDTWIHPVDGLLTGNGRILHNQAFQIKGWNYTTSKLLGEQRYDFDRGYFLTYYLCPTDYHRIHSPVAGEIVSVRHLRGQLYPVNDLSVRNIPELFCRNERVVVNISTAMGPVAVVMVGATNVGDIEVVSDPELSTNVVTNDGPYFKRLTPPLPVEVGDELGVFHMGSTVVVIVAPGYAGDIREISKQKVKFGEGVRSMLADRSPMANEALN